MAPFILKKIFFYRRCDFESLKMESPLLSPFSLNKGLHGNIFSCVGGGGLGPCMEEAIDIKVLLCQLLLLRLGSGPPAPFMQILLTHQPLCLWRERLGQGDG